MSEKLQPKDNKLENPERRAFFGDCRTAALESVGVLLGLSCASQQPIRRINEPATNSPHARQDDGNANKFDDVEENNETEEHSKPYWVDGPDVFEKDGNAYAVSSRSFNDWGHMSISRSVAEMDARTKLVCHFNGVNTTYNDDGICIGSLMLSRTIESYIEEKEDETKVFHVLMSAPIELNTK